MSVEMVMWVNGNPRNTHKCWYTFVKKIDHTAWRNSDNLYRIDLLNQMLVPYQATVSRFDLTTGISFEFESQDDLTAFVLVWS